MPYSYRIHTLEPHASFKKHGEEVSSSRAAISEKTKHTDQIHILNIEDDLAQITLIEEALSEETEPRCSYYYNDRVCRRNYCSPGRQARCTRLPAQGPDGCASLDPFHPLCN